MDNEILVNAIYDLARVTVAMGMPTASNAEATRRLHEAGIAPSKIAQILNLKLKDVTSTIAKSKARRGK